MYQRVLRGEIKQLSAKFFSDLKNRDVYIRSILRYVIEQNGWTKENCKEHLSKEFFKQANLTSAVKHIPCPKDSYEDDYSYVQEFLYPDIEKGTLEERALRIYRIVLSGEKSRFPKDFFYETEECRGQKRIKICVKYLLEEKLSMPLEERESLFLTNSAKAKHLLRQNRLGILLTTIFDTPEKLYTFVYQQ